MKFYQTLKLKAKIAKIMSVLIIMITALSLITSCSKEEKGKPEDGNSVKKSLVNKITRTAHSPYTWINDSLVPNPYQAITITYFDLTYNNSGKLSSIVYTYSSGYERGNEHYSWGSGSLQYELQERNGFHMTGNYTRNAQGYVVSGNLNEELSGSSHSLNTNYTYIYNKNNHLVQVKTSATNSLGSSGSGTTEYVWENDNLVSVSYPKMALSGGDTTYTIYFEYFTDIKESRDIGLRHFSPTHHSKWVTMRGGQGGSVGATEHFRSLLTQSRLPFPSKNLLKKIIEVYPSGEKNVTEYNYDFDSKGRVIRETVFSNLVKEAKTEYEYEYLD